MGSESYHEPYKDLSGSTRNMHRALTSLMEELEAIDWYQQRAEVTDDDELRAVLLHNRAEEIEHAIMTLEWLRRNDPKFDEYIRTYLMKTAPITKIEEQAEGKGGGGGGGNDDDEGGDSHGGRGGRGGHGGHHGGGSRSSSSRGLGIGSLKRK
jgi:uncharacterized protein